MNENTSYKNGIFPLAEITLEDILSFSVNRLQIILMFGVLVVKTVTGSDKVMSVGPKKECYSILILKVSLRHS